MKRGYSEALANKAVKEVYDLATNNSGSLYQRNKVMYSLLRYGKEMTLDEPEFKIRSMKAKWGDLKFSRKTPQILAQAMAQTQKGLQRLKIKIRVSGL